MINLPAIIDSSGLTHYNDHTTDGNILLQLLDG